MPRLIEQPTVIAAAGNKPKQIRRIRRPRQFRPRRRQRGADGLAARLAGARPAARVRGDHRRAAGRAARRARGRHARRRAGQAIVTAPGEWVRYSTPEPDGAEYIAVCLPAFSPATVHRDDERLVGRAFRPAYGPENSTATSSALNGRSTSANPTLAAARPMTLAAVHPALRRSRTLVSRSALLNFCVADFITSR